MRLVFLFVYHSIAVFFTYPFSFEFAPILQHFSFTKACFFVQQQNVDYLFWSKRVSVHSDSCQTPILFSPLQSPLMYQITPQDNQEFGCVEDWTACMITPGKTHLPNGMVIWRLMIRISTHHKMIQMAVHRKRMLLHLLQEHTTNYMDKNSIQAIRWLHYNISFQ
jgi:hypothetical protein